MTTSRFILGTLTTFAIVGATFTGNASPELLVLTIALLSYKRSSLPPKA